jgi:hypothetical protein
MDSLERHAWLYLRGEQSIQITCDSMTVLVCGPDTAERVHATQDEEARFALLHGYDAELRREGWSLQSYVNRRTARQDTASIPLDGDRRRPSSDRSAIASVLYPSEFAVAYLSPPTENT